MHTTTQGFQFCFRLRLIHQATPPARQVGRTQRSAVPAFVDVLALRDCRIGVAALLDPANLVSNIETIVKVLGTN